jgi:hypothetical protein
MKKSIDELPIKFNTIGENIVHIVMPDRNTLAAAVIRFQEYYESPFPEIKGKVFTLGYIKSLGSRDNRGINTYCGNDMLNSDWSGYNFPGAVLDPFIKGLFDPLTAEESVIVETLRYRQDNFYVIATYGDTDPGDTLEHEIRHAMFGISDAYKKEVMKQIDKYKKELVPLRKVLSSWGYADEVLDDECHAYMSCDHDYFFENFTADVKKFKVTPVPKLRDVLNRLAKKHKEKLGI